MQSHRWNTRSSSTDAETSARSSTTSATHVMCSVAGANTARSWQSVGKGRIGDFVRHHDALIAPPDYYITVTRVVTRRSILLDPAQRVKLILDRPVGEGPVSGSRKAG